MGVLKVRFISVLSISLGLLTACGGGGGGGSAPVDLNDPNAIALRISVVNTTSELIAEEAPKSSAVAEAPIISSTESELQLAAVGDTLELDLDVESLDGVSSLLARISAASSYFLISDPALSENTAKNSKLLGGTLFSGSISLLLGQALAADQFCLEIAAVDFSGRVSKYRKMCFDLPGNRGASTAPKPLVSAGGDQSVAENDTVQLNGIANQTSGSITDYEWRQISGPSVTLNAVVASAQFTAPNVDAPATVSLELKVTSADGQTATDITNVHITNTDVNAAPLVKAGNDLIANEGATIELRGLATDSDGNLNSIAWSQTAGPSVSINPTNAVSASLTAPNVGAQGATIVLQLSATDNQGASSNDSLSIRVNNLNNVPQANGTSYTVIRDETLTDSLASFASDADAETLTFSVGTSTGQGALNLQGNGDFSYTPNAQYTGADSFTYSVNDGSANSNTATVSINVVDLISTSGGAAKGVISGGTISANEISGGQQTNRGSSSTDQNGDFDLSLAGYTGGPLLISLQGGNGATMKCDVAAGCTNGDGSPVAFGGLIDLPSSFSMQTLLPSVSSSADLASCISPFTHLAAARAAELAGGDINAVSTQQASSALSEVGALLGGIDVLRTCAADLTDSMALESVLSDKLALSALASAVLGVQGASDPSLALSHLLASFAGGLMPANDDDSDATVVSVQDLVDAARQELNALGKADNSGVLVAMELAANTAGAGNSVDPTPNASAGDANIEQGKALIAGIRTLGLSLFEDVNDYAETDNGHPANIFYDKLVAANDEALLESLNQGLVMAYEEAENFYNRDASQPGLPGTTTISSSDGSGNSQSATVTITNNSGGIHVVTVQGQIKDTLVDWRVSSPTDIGTVGNRPSGALSGQITATARSASTSAPGYALSVSGDIDVSALQIGTLTNTTPQLPSASINIDGNAADWAGLTSFSDPSSDQTGNNATDLQSFAAVYNSSNDSFNILMRTSGSMAFPHTSGQNTSHYETGIHVFWDEACENEAGFFVANHFTDAGGTQTHQLDDYVFFNPAAATTVASQNNTLETSFSMNVFSPFSSFWINPYIQSFGSTNIRHDGITRDLEESSCYNFNSASTETTETYENGGISFDLAFEFSQINVSNPITIDGDIEFEIVNCSNCPTRDGQSSLNLASLLVNASLYDEEHENGSGFIFTVNFDEAAQNNFDFREDISPSNVPAADFSLGINAALAGTDYAVTVSGELDDILSVSAAEVGTGDFTEADAAATIRIEREGRYLVISASAPSQTTDLVLFDFSFSNQDGVSLSFQSSVNGTDTIAGDVFIGSTKVGTLEQTNSGLILIRWVDGSFESLG